MQAEIIKTKKYVTYQETTNWRQPFQEVHERVPADGFQMPHPSSARRVSSWADKYCDYLEATVIAPGREDMQMYEWFIRRSTICGRLLIQLPPKANQSEPDCQEIYFEEAQCFSFEEKYHSNLNQRRMLRLQFVAEQVIINGITFKRP